MVLIIKGNGERKRYTHPASNTVLVMKSGVRVLVEEKYGRKIKSYLKA